MTDTPFQRLFQSDNLPRDAFRSRLFGLFSEEIVRHWSQNDRAPYRDLGRPTLWEGKRFATLDFTLESRADGRCYVAEQKSEMAFEAYRYLRLTKAEQVAHHARVRAFAWFLNVARGPASYVVQVRSKPIEVAGAILVWGAITPEGRAGTRETFGFVDVLSLEAMLEDLRAWDDRAWRARVDELRA